MPLNNLASAAEIAIGERLLIGSGAIAYMLRQWDRVEPPIVSLEGSVTSNSGQFEQGIEIAQLKP